MSQSYEWCLILHISATATGDVLYVSKARGKDGTNTCRNITSPCGTLNYVIKIAKGNDVIMLDSYNTEKIPYNTCTTWATPGNLSFNSWNYGSAIINCSGNELNFEGNTTNLEFQGLTFLDSFLRVSDIFLIINNCSFGSFSQNTFPYLIHVSVNNPGPNFGIYITSSNFLERNTAGALQVVN